ncbi:MAG: crossover junction endodeoxyribonuclease RuvC [Candidatus Cloacimonetes bacterium]|nr:crossover junction endodeoxyribonuclease RuvC [Candidatus Cloacimonadota bacterium]MBL7086077.1 crossover junction endodeoxyribonuclease RuvC [Candidatus Cloacimonadota bacterium]
MNKFTILGIDPGTTATGYAFLSTDTSEKNVLIPIEYGVIKVNPRLALQQRVSEIYNRIKDLIQKFKPDEASIETIFHAKNIKSILSMGDARGVIMLALAQENIPVFEYSPREIKKAVVGNGNASKKQVQYMVKAILNLKEVPSSYDVTDALAIAICHFNKREKDL